MTKTIQINAKEVAEILGTSKSHAYKVVQQLNKVGKSFFMAQLGYSVGTGTDLWGYRRR